MLRFESRNGKTYHRKRLNLLVFLVIAATVLLRDYCVKIEDLTPYNGTIQTVFFLVMIVCGIYIAVKLFELFGKRPEFGDADYEEEFVELYEDHIKICELAAGVNKQKYDYATIYYEDIDITRLHTDYMTIFILRSPSERTQINTAHYFDHRTFRVGIGRYPKELREQLQGSYRQLMKVV